MHLCWKLVLMMMVFVCVTKQQDGKYRHITRAEVSCCKEVSKGRLPLEYKLTGYKHQSALGPCVEATIVFTEKETFCFDPKANWIQNRLKKDEKKTEE